MGPLLSICITTKNRSLLLRETLASITNQVKSRVEIVVVDSSSNEETKDMIGELSKKANYIKYHFNADLNLDQGYDLAVCLSAGTYCWLLPDDDLIVNGAVEQVFQSIEGRYDLIVLNLECYSKDLSVNLHQRLHRSSQDAIFTSANVEDFFSKYSVVLSYVGSVLIKRDVWFENDRSIFFGTWFAHVGVILSSSLIKNILCLSEPLIKYRSGNASWTPRSFEVFNFKWPSLIWSFNKYSEVAREMVTPRQPWRRSLSLLKSRAMGEYNSDIYNSYLSSKISLCQRILPYLISRVPVTLVSMLLIIYCLIFKRLGLFTLYNLMVSSPNPKAARKLMRVFGLCFPAP